MNKKIGVLDSGIGGTTVLDKIVELLPKEEYEKLKQHAIYHGEGIPLSGLIYMAEKRRGKYGAVTGSRRCPVSGPRIRKGKEDQL